MATRLAPARPVRAPRPEATPSTRPHLRVVPADYVSARTRRKRARLVVVLSGIAIAAALFGVVAFHVVLTQNQLDLQHLQAQADAASVRQQQLRLQVAQLESPERVVDAAQKLGMVPPATVRYLSPNGAAAPPPPAPRPTTPTTARAAAPKATTPKAAALASKATPTVPATAKTTVPARTTAPKATATTAPARPTP
jgi:cell division protein FtsL